MPLLLALLLGVFAYLYWKRTATTLTRNCRWRQDRAAGDWACGYCNQRLKTSDGNSPKTCQNNR